MSKRLVKTPKQGTARKKCVIQKSKNDKQANKNPKPNQTTNQNKTQTLNKTIFLRKHQNRRQLLLPSLYVRFMQEADIRYDEGRYTLNNSMQKALDKHIKKYVHIIFRKLNKM